MSTLGAMAQSIEPPIRRGEAATLTFTGSFAATPAAWNVALWMRLHPAGDWTEFDSGISVSVTGSGPYSATWTVPLTDDNTSALGSGLNEFTLRRTDSGSETVLSAGTVLVLD